MSIRTSEAVWEGDVQWGHGTIKLGSGAWEGPYSFISRFRDGKGTNPEELLGAAHAGCFSMALSKILSDAGHPPERIHTTAKVHLEKVGGGFGIPRIELATEVQVPGIDLSTFQQYADTAKRTCPVSKLFGGAEITLDARLETEAPVGV
jgi:lipoyl-dependent peroxiredoxin